MSLAIFFLFFEKSQGEVKIENYKKSSHCTYDIKYHHEVDIPVSHVGSDHIHLLESVPPYLLVGKLVWYIKRNISRKL